MSLPPLNAGEARVWRCAPSARDGCDELARALSVSPTVAGLLMARGFADPEAARRFLFPSLDDLHDPFLLPDMDAAVTRLARAIETHERILVHGDYDVDGVTSTALLTRVLRALGANVQHFVPDRRDDGYDLRIHSVQRASKEGVQLIVTVDCGIVAYEAAECACDLGIDLIVTDHHQPGERLPRAVAVVNPHRVGSLYPFPELAGVGVAFKTATALVRKLKVPEHSFRTKFLDLVALGTTVDCMPLLGENRVFVKFGLETLKQASKPGLKALMEVADVKPERLDSRSLSFMLGPRINAVGRLDEARHALDLLLTGDAKIAAELARKLDRCNQERQQAQSRMINEALLQALHPARQSERILVLADTHWHSGVIGIAAGKMAEQLGRPVIMIALDGETGRGSARSVDGFHIFNTIDSCRDVLERCGGHAQAAGFDIRAERVEEFRQRVCQVADRELTDEALQPRINVDSFLDVADVGMKLARELHCMEPFGHGNPEPVFATSAFPVIAIRNHPARTGQHPHLSLKCRVAQGAAVQAWYWRNGEKAEELQGAPQLDLCYRLEINRYQGNETVQLNIQDLRLPQSEIQ
jgi:single-stranded-DNA-specific exonuclease